MLKLGAELFGSVVDGPTGSKVPGRGVSQWIFRVVFPGHAGVQISLPKEVFVPEPTLVVLIDPAVSQVPGDTGDVDVFCSCQSVGKAEIYIAIWVIIKTKIIAVVFHIEIGKVIITVSIGILYPTTQFPSCQLEIFRVSKDAVSICVE